MPDGRSKLGQVDATMPVSKTLARETQVAW
jgi:hypothetical protein